MTIVTTICLGLFLLNSCSQPRSTTEETASDIKQIPRAVLRDKIAGGWAGKMIGVSYGGWTEFSRQGEIIEYDIPFDPASLKEAISQDDLYVQMSFMMAMDKYGLDATGAQYAEEFANAGYMLFHANRKGRKNFWDGIMPPDAGNPQYSLHADDIDFQIEADYIGFMNPGMPQHSNKMCDVVGHVMNYGDGVYGGMFVAALYAESYFENDIPTIIAKALQSIPAESKYAMCIQDVIDGHKANPEDWTATWQIIQDRWGEDDICGALDDFNIDAKVNGAYIVIGLLYGEGDFMKTLEYSTRCGQDSDCNPSNAAGVLGIILGYDKIPAELKQHIPEIADKKFIYTDYSFNSVVERTLHYAEEIVLKNGGSVKNDMFYIKTQQPLAPPLEQSFPGIKAAYRSTIFEEEGWTWNGDWKLKEIKDPWGGSEELMYSEQPGSEFTFTFTGTGALLMGHWDQYGGKADVYVDDVFARQIDNYYFVDGHGAGSGWLNSTHLFHVMGLEEDEHHIRLVISDEKNEAATGSATMVSRAIVYTQDAEQN